MSILAKYNAAMEAKDEAAMNEILHDDYKSVSYTHLRAHETKANLVCRLLLEKKKQKNKMQ